jgi:hypothetical protein
VAQGGRATATVAKAGGGVTEVDTSGQQLAGGVMTQCLDVEADTGAGGDLRDFVCHPVGIPRRATKRVIGENVWLSRPS